MTSLAEAAADAYLAGWALTGAPLTERVQAGCYAAVGCALEHPRDPGILEAALDLGHLEGIWATVYQRRERLLRKHLSAVLAAWNACMADLDPRDAAKRFRQAIYLPAEAATKDPTKRWWQDTAIATALGWLRGVYHAGGYDALVAAIEDAIREGMAEGEADALAVAASQQGKTGFDIAAAFTVARQRLANDHSVTQMAAAAATAIIDGAAYDAGRRLASMAADGASEDEMASAVQDVTAGSDVRSVRAYLGDAIWAGIGAAVTALYRAARVQIDWITDGDPCQACQACERGSPYAPGAVPDYPQHPHCKCELSTSSRLPIALLAAFLP